MFRLLTVLICTAGPLVAGQVHAQTPPSGPPTSIEGTLPTGLRERESFEAPFKVKGGTPPFAWRVSAGALPDGVLLHSRNGFLHGTPSKRGKYRFTIEARDANGAVVTRSFELTVLYKPAGRRL